MEIIYKILSIISLMREIKVVLRKADNFEETVYKIYSFSYRPKQSWKVKCRFAFNLSHEDEFTTVNYERGYPFRHVRDADRIVC